MILTFLADRPWLASVGFVVVVVGCLVLGALLVRRRRAAGVLSVVLALGVVALALQPSGRDPVVGGCRMEVDLAGITGVEPLSNVAVFVPITCFAVVAGMRWWATLLAGSLLSLAIEVAQRVLPALGRSCVANDWVMNTIGAAIGVLLALLALRLTPRVEQRTK